MGAGRLVLCRVAGHFLSELLADVLVSWPNRVAAHREIARQGLWGWFVDVLVIVARHVTLLNRYKCD